MAFAIKAAILDAAAETFEFPAQKTMYGGKAIAAGDVVFIFASENHGGRGLFARGRVIGVEPLPRVPGPGRQTPRVSVRVRRESLATKPLGRAELKPFASSDTDAGLAELQFKFYRQATDKIVGLSEAATAALDRFF
ncbi:hypothetical protein SAMN02745157_3476 [Kaistia soli DSM 19436]|uniref:EVE domain-containing protein n=1 Tax=Kaistia soli DSM 19436 TaxID=1122133 RepID=A0A1M5GP76_9HYPH|nr:hypothetical protein [Kaistia soli]SHG05534.1 hypothetical protein SAMN02745157_3476 [Kaistia soli DSM 19436]